MLLQPPHQPAHLRPLPAGHLTSRSAVEVISLGPSCIPRVLQGWSNDDEGEPVFYEFKDGTTFDCPRRCTLAFDFLYEPAIWDPATGERC